MRESLSSAVGELQIVLITTAMPKDIDSCSNRVRFSESIWKREFTSLYILQLTLLLAKERHMSSLVFVFPITGSKWRRVFVLNRN